jgi:hypothetical protein
VELQVGFTTQEAARAVTIKNSMSLTIIEIYSYADIDDSWAVADKVYGEFIEAIKGNPEIDRIECFVGKKFVSVRNSPS